MPCMHVDMVGMAMRWVWSITFVVDFLWQKRHTARNDNSWWLNNKLHQQDPVGVWLATVHPSRSRYYIPGWQWLFTGSSQKKMSIRFGLLGLLQIMKSVMMVTRIVLIKWLEKLLEALSADTVSHWCQYWRTCVDLKRFTHRRKTAAVGPPRAQMTERHRKKVRACKSLCFGVPDLFNFWCQAKVASLDGEYPHDAELALICLDVVSTCGALSARVAQVRTPCHLKRWISTRQCTSKAHGHGGQETKWCTY